MKRSDPRTGLCGTSKTGLVYEKDPLSMTHCFRLLGMNKTNFYQYFKYHSNLVFQVRCCGLLYQSRNFMISFLLAEKLTPEMTDISAPISRAHFVLSINKSEHILC